MGIMGGTFDPVHLGHLIAAEQARLEVGLDEVWFLPSNLPPHKQHSPLVQAEQRCHMVELAIENHPAFKLEPMELEREGKSYTVDTAKELFQRFPEHQFHFIIGADMVNDLPHWFKVEEIVKYMSFIGLERAGHTMNLQALPDWLQPYIRTAPMPFIEISSTDIRERLQSGKSIRYLVPDAVYDYIEENGWYGT
ncbi:nicotinate-nucleotide adenylyltransferase [Marinicrinis lubricantis]|uniref:Probable nicotinate-nucleotide adenylyltransferase n=1 Tax=Marinicrinis lubricantis TaxID=2086470 RepID=A0ABW1IV76_9BACL